MRAKLCSIRKAINLKPTLQKRKEHLSPCLATQQRAEGSTQQQEAGHPGETKQTCHSPEGIWASWAPGAASAYLGWKQHPESQSVWPSPFMMMLPLGKAHIFHRRSSLPVTTMSFLGCRAKLWGRKGVPCVKGMASGQGHHLWHVGQTAEDATICPKSHHLG